MFKHRRPAWLLLWALVPLLVGLFVLEHRALLSPGGHKGMQVGIVLFIYGLVWLWRRANTRQLLWSDQETSGWQRAADPRAALIRLPRARLTPRQAHLFAGHTRYRNKRFYLQALRRRIRKCSVNFDRRSS